MKKNINDHSFVYNFPEMNYHKFQMDGIKVEVGRVQEDLTFMKKGYSGVFDIVSNAADSQQCRFKTRFIYF